MIAKINFWFCIFTWVTFIGSSYLFGCNFSSESGIYCKIGGIFEIVLSFLYGIAMFSAMLRMFTLFLFDFWAFYYLILCLEGKNKKVIKNEKAI
jgi:hypothetical protein